MDAFVNFFCDVRVCVFSATVLRFDVMYELAAKCRRKFLSSRDECFERVCRNGDRVVTSVTVHGDRSSCFEGTWSGCKNTYVIGFFSLHTMEKLIHAFCFSTTKPGFRCVGEINSQNSQAGSAGNSALTHEIPLHDEKKLVFGVRWVHAVRIQQFPGKNSRE